MIISFKRKEAILYSIEILLKKADAGDNADDVVKKYTYHFVGRKMDGVDVKTEE